MISSNALIFHSKKTLKMLQKSPHETPYIVQIAGSDLGVIKKAVMILNEIEGIDGIDLNCGCPVPKVVSQNAGSALLKDLDHMAKIIECIKKHSNKRYTSVKTRLGFSEKIPSIIAKICENAGADFVAVHGRTRAGAYKAEVDYEAIREFKSSIKIPVIANGDIDSYEKAKFVKDSTGCDGIMIGRGAIGNPWIFYQIKNELPRMKKEKIKEIVLEHFNAVIDFYGENGIKIFRKHLHTYSKSLPNASIFRDKINKISYHVEMKEEIERFFSY